MAKNIVKLRPENPVTIQSLNDKIEKLTANLRMWQDEYSKESDKNASFEETQTKAKTEIKRLKEEIKSLKEEIEKLQQKYELFSNTPVWRIAYDRVQNKLKKIPCITLLFPRRKEGVSAPPQHSGKTTLSLPQPRT